MSDSDDNSNSGENEEEQEQGSDDDDDEQEQGNNSDKSDKDEDEDEDEDDGENEDDGIDKEDSDNAKDNEDQSMEDQIDSSDVANEEADKIVFDSSKLQQITEFSMTYPYNTAPQSPRNTTNGLQSTPSFMKQRRSRHLITLGENSSWNFISNENLIHNSNSFTLRKDKETDRISNGQMTSEIRSHTAQTSTNTCNNSWLNLLTEVNNDMDLLAKDISIFTMTTEQQEFNESVKYRKRPTLRGHCGESRAEFEADCQCNSGCKCCWNKGNTQRAPRFGEGRYPYAPNKNKNYYESLDVSRESLRNGDYDIMKGCYEDKCSNTEPGMYRGNSGFERENELYQFNKWNNNNIRNGYFGYRID